jgi:hypothetical protein
LRLFSNKKKKKKKKEKKKILYIPLGVSKTNFMSGCRVNGKENASSSSSPAPPPPLIAVVSPEEFIYASKAKDELQLTINAKRKGLKCRYKGGRRTGKKNRFEKKRKRISEVRVTD